MYLLTLVAPVFAASGRVLAFVARLTERPSGVLKVAAVGYTRVADLANEAVRMPVQGHRFDHATNDELLCTQAYNIHVSRDVTACKDEHMANGDLMCQQYELAATHHVTHVNRRYGARHMNTTR